MNKTILVVGDSLCKGVSLNEERKRYFFLKNSFANNLKKALDADIVNMAKFGTTVLDGEGKLKQRLDKYNPDIVLIEYGGNDCDFDWNKIAEHPEMEHKPNIQIDEFESHLKSMIETVLDFGATPVLMTLPPLNAVNYFKWFTKDNKDMQKSVLKWLGDVSKIYWWQESYSLRVNSVANACKVPIIDVRSNFLSTPDFRKYVCLDGIHPNENGHKLITSSILDCFKNNPQSFNFI